MKETINKSWLFVIDFFFFCLEYDDKGNLIFFFKKKKDYVNERSLQERK